MPEKIFDVLDLAGHDRLRDAGRLQDLDTLAQVAERHPVEGPRRASRAACSSSGNASSLTATTVTSWPRLRAPWSARNGNRPLPAMRPIRVMRVDESIRRHRRSRADGHGDGSTCPAATSRPASHLRHVGAVHAWVRSSGMPFDGVASASNRLLLRDRPRWSSPRRLRQTATTTATDPRRRRR